MKQLKMLRPQGPLKVKHLPQGYTYQDYQGTDEEMQDWLTICRHGLIDECADVGAFLLSIVTYPDLDPKRDLFFVVNPQGRRVATTAAVLHTGGEGYIHMVAALPESRGQGIGHAMLYHALQRLQMRGSAYTTLTADDHRLAAIKTYLDAGFLPVVYHDPNSDMRQRWDDVIAQLGYMTISYVEEV